MQLPLSFLKNFKRLKYQKYWIVNCRSWSLLPFFVFISRKHGKLFSAFEERHYLHLPSQIESWNAILYIYDLFPHYIHKPYCWILSMLCIWLEDNINSNCLKCLRLISIDEHISVAHIHSKSWITILIVLIALELFVTIHVWCYTYYLLLACLTRRFWS